jgi:DNA polymerase-3 subunit delta
MRYEEIIKDLKNRIFYPIYLLHGDEPYYIDALTDYISEHVLSDVEKEFNLTVVYGLDVSGSDVVDHAKRYPMMASHHVVILREAQNLDKEIDQLTLYAANPSKSTILVIAHKYKKVSRLKGLEKMVQKTGLVFESKKLYDNNVPGWIEKHISSFGYRIPESSSQLLANSLGNDLSRIVNECAKLMINLPAGSTITPEVIEQNVGISKDFNPFELTKALSMRHVFRVNQIVNYFGANAREYPAVLVISVLYSYFYKTWIYHQLPDKSRKSAASALGMSDYILNDYIAAAKTFSYDKTCQILLLLYEYDMRSKGLHNDSVSGPELIKELVYKIMAA